MMSYPRIANREIEAGPRFTTNEGTRLIYKDPSMPQELFLLKPSTHSTRTEINQPHQNQTTHNYNHV
jgi:hypothetical protein